MEDLYESRGFLGSEILPERREELWLVAGDDKKHSSHARRDITILGHVSWSLSSPSNG